MGKTFRWMKKMQARTSIIIAILLLPIFAHGMVYDSRFFPLFPHPFIKPDGYRSGLAVDYMMATASSAINRRDDKTGIFELAGSFDLGQMATAYDIVYGPEIDPVSQEFRSIELPWHVDGKLQMQGFVISFNHYFCEQFSAGGSMTFMRVNSRQEFLFNRSQSNSSFYTPMLIEILDQQRRELLGLLGLENRSAQLGIGDIELFIRPSFYCEYAFKCRRVDIGLQLGILIPSGVKRELKAPTSVPFGGNGHFGFYADLDGLFELREDLKLGLLFRVIKRTPKTMCERLPVDGEPFIYAPMIGDVRINPGCTLVFSPWILIESLRKGFGIGAYYTLTKHEPDNWRTVSGQSLPAEPKLFPVMQASTWASEYITLEAFYDFGKVATTRSFDPILSLRWDIPVALYVRSNVPKTQLVSLGVEWAY